MELHPMLLVRCQKAGESGSGDIQSFRLAYPVPIKPRLSTILKLNSLKLKRISSRSSEPRSISISNQTRVMLSAPKWSEASSPRTAAKCGIRGREAFSAIDCTTVIFQGPPGSWLFRLRLTPDSRPLTPISFPSVSIRVIRGQKLPFPSSALNLRTSASICG